MRRSGDGQDHHDNFHAYLTCPRGGRRMRVLAALEEPGVLVPGHRPD
jgi:hypothetical protein